MAKQKEPTRESFTVSPGTRYEIHFNRTGRIPVEIDFGPYGVVSGWVRREDGMVLTVGTAIPTIRYLDAEDLHDTWPLTDPKTR